MRSEIHPSNAFHTPWFDQRGLHREIGVIFAGKGKIQSFDHDIHNGSSNERLSLGKSSFSLRIMVKV